MNESIFLMDSNAFIEPANNYYRFGFAKKFWDQLEVNIKDGSIAILDLVKAEILKGDDALSDWMRDIEICHYIDRKQPEMLQIYRQVLDGVQTNKCYKAIALSDCNLLQSHKRKFPQRIVLLNMS